MTDLTWHPCVKERVWVRDPTGERILPRGPGLKLRNGFDQGQPVQAEVRLDSGQTSRVPLDWITDTPRYDDTPAAEVVDFTRYRARRQIAALTELAARMNPSPETA